MAEQNKKLKWWQWALIAFLALAIIGALTGKPDDAQQSASAPEQTAPDRVEATSLFEVPDPPITMAEYTALQTGMTEEQAFGVVGQRCEESSRTEMAGFSTVAYSCVNPGGANAILMFQNNALVSKAQVGLQ